MRAVILGVLGLLEVGIDHVHARRREVHEGVGLHVGGARAHVLDDVDREERLVYDQVFAVHPRSRDLLTT